MPLQRGIFHLTSDRLGLCKDSNGFPVASRSHVRRCMGAWLGHSPGSAKAAESYMRYIISYGGNECCVGRIRLGL